MGLADYRGRGKDQGNPKTRFSYAAVCQRVGQVWAGGHSGPGVQHGKAAPQLAAHGRRHHRVRRDHGWHRIAPHRPSGSGTADWGFTNTPEDSESSGEAGWLPVGKHMTGRTIRIQHESGIMQVEVQARNGDARLVVERCVVTRTAMRLREGNVFYLMMLNSVRFTDSDLFSSIALK